MNINRKRLLLRLVVSPLIFALVIIVTFTSSIRRLWGFIKYGGEFIILEENDKPTIDKIYRKLKEQENNNQQLNNE